MNNKVSIINYGMGNLRSVENAIKRLNFTVDIISTPNDLDNSNKIILPGVGSFKKAMKLLKDSGWVDRLHFNVIEKKKDILGICLGMQLFGTQSEEFGLTEGLNFIEGNIKSLSNIGCKKKLPQIGWNSITISKDHHLLEGIPTATDFYFVNSFVFVAKDKSYEVASSNYEIDFTSVICKENVYGTQFHPEKSSKAGRKLLMNFLNAKN